MSLVRRWNGSVWEDVGIPGTIVTTDATQTITGLKTFTTAPVFPTGSIPINRLIATGTADATTYLRGDGTWQVISGGGGTPANMVTTDTSQVIASKTIRGSNIPLFGMEGAPGDSGIIATTLSRSSGTVDVWFGVTGTIAFLANDAPGDMTFRVNNASNSFRVGVGNSQAATTAFQVSALAVTSSILMVASNGLNLAAGKKLDLDPAGQAGYMMAESVSATTFTDSLSGDTVFRESNAGRQLFGPATAGGAAQASMFMIGDAGIAVGRGTKSFGSGSGLMNLTDATTAPTVNATSGIFLYSAGGRGKVRDGVGNVWNLDGAMVFRLGTAYTNATTTLTSTALASGTLGAGSYVFEINGAYASSATTAGIKAAILATGTVTNIMYTLVASTSATANTTGVSLVSGTSLPTTPVVVSAATTNWQFQMTGSIALSTAGTITLQAAASGTGTITLPIGCYMVIRRQA